MSRPNSYAFVLGEPGSLRIKGTDWCEEPSAEEREQALGYATGTTIAPGVSDLQRRMLLGSCMDASCVQSIFAIISAVYRHRGAPACLVQYTSSSRQEGEWVNPATTPAELDELIMLTVIATKPEEKSDIWNDPATLHFLCTGLFLGPVVEAERLRIQRRATCYMHSLADENHQIGPLSKDGLLRKLENGSTRVVPDVPEREAVVRQVHDLSGHFGLRRTESILLASYWWPGIRKDVATVVGQCAVSDRVRKQFNKSNPNLNPLIIRGLFYRWGIDLCGLFPLSPHQNRHCCVMIEHYSKHMEIVAIPDKEPATIARVFLDGVISRYGCCAEVISDNGGNLKGNLQNY